MSSAIRRKSNRRNSNKVVRRNFRSAIPNQLYAQTFPREMKVTLKWSSIYSFTASASLASDIQFRLNSIYDPFFSGAGSQPQGHDQWANFYGKYRVDAAHVNVQWCNLQLGCICTIVGNNSTSGLSNPGDAEAAPGSITQAATPGSIQPRLSKTYDLAQLNGVSRSVYNADDRYSASFGANPTENLMLHVVTTELLLAAFVNSYVVTISYDVTLFDPEQLGAS